MNVHCLMPTYGRTRQLLENALACFLWQTYDRSRLRLTVFDDEGFLDTTPRNADGWSIVSTSTRCANLGAKYNQMVAADDGWADAFAVWDDDDLYLPDHVANNVAAMRSPEGRGTWSWSQPSNVWSTYTGSPELEASAGRFHGSLFVARAAASWIATRRADFDQQFLAALARDFGSPARPDDHKAPTYVFRWADTGSTHCQGLMRSPSNETWWESYAVEVARRRRANNEQRPGQLVPRYDDAAVATFKALEAKGVRL